MAIPLFRVLVSVHLANTSSATKLVERLAVPRGKARPVHSSAPDREPVRLVATGSHVVADLPIEDRAFADAAWDTLLSLATPANLQAPTHRQWSEMSMHVCWNDDTARRRCDQYLRTWTNRLPPLPAWAPGTYAKGSEVIHNEQLWRADAAGTTTEPGTTGWTVI